MCVCGYLGPCPVCLCLYVCVGLHVSLCVCLWVSRSLSCVSVSVSTCSRDSQKPQPTPFSVWPTFGATGRSVSWKMSPIGPLTQSHFLLPPPAPKAGNTGTHNADPQPDSPTCLCLAGLGPGKGSRGHGGGAVRRRIPGSLCAQGLATPSLPNALIAERRRVNRGSPGLTQVRLSLCVRSFWCERLILNFPLTFFKVIFIDWVFNVF